MKLFLGCAAAFAVASVGACAGEKAAVSLAGKWTGTITCYSMESPLQVAIDAATPEKATVGMGDGGAISWEASVAFDDATRAVTIKSDAPMGDAHIIAGTLDADGKDISGAMDKQLCNAFKLARQS